MEAYSPAELENSVFDLLTDNVFVDQFEEQLASHGHHFDFTQEANELAIEIVATITDNSLAIVLGMFDVGVATAVYNAVKHPERNRSIIGAIATVIDETAAGAVNGVNGALGREHIETYGQSLRRRRRY